MNATSTGWGEKEHFGGGLLIIKTIKRVLNNNYCQEKYYQTYCSKPESYFYISLVAFYDILKDKWLIRPAIFMDAEK